MEEESYEVILVMLLLAPFMTDMPTLRLAVVEFRIVLFFASGPSTAMPVPVAESRMVRLDKVLDDIGKPATAKPRDGKEVTFYGHEVVGARMTEKILKRLKFPNEIVEVVTKLVRNHLFFSDVEKITLSAVRRIIKNVGPESVWDLMSVRSCDRIGMGRPVEAPYRLRKYHSMIEEAMKDPVSVGMLKINGNDIMKNLGEKPGPKIGFTLHALLEEVLDDPKLNTTEYLEKRARELLKLPENELRKLGEAGKEKKEDEEAKEVGEIRKKFGVK